MIFTTAMLPAAAMLGAALVPAGSIRSTAGVTRITHRSPDIGRWQRSGSQGEWAFTTGIHAEPSAHAIDELAAAGAAANAVVASSRISLWIWMGIDIDRTL
jgi:hypothetical protein